MATITGVVNDSATGQPVENASVSSYNPVSKVLFDTTNTSPTGAYSVSTPVDFQTYLVVNATGYPSKVADFTDEQTEPYVFQIGKDDILQFTTPVLIGLSDQTNVNADVTKSIDKPAGTEVNDLIVLFVGHRSVVVESTLTNQGFTLFNYQEDTVGVNGTFQHTSIYTKKATDSEPLQYDVEVTEASRIMLSMAVIRDGLLDVRVYEQYENTTPWTIQPVTNDPDVLQLLFTHWLNSNSSSKIPTFSPIDSVTLASGFSGTIRNFVGSTTTNLPIEVSGLNPDEYSRITRLSVKGLPLKPFKAMIRGNVTKLGMPFGTKIIAVSTANPPTVVGTATSSPDTGDYEVDVAPYQGQCNVMAVPNYGIEFTADSTYPTGELIRPTTPNGYLYRVSEAGTAANTEPTWPTQENQVIVSGTVTMVTEIMLRPLVNSLLTPVIEQQ